MRLRKRRKPNAKFDAATFIKVAVQFVPYAPFPPWHGFGFVGINERNDIRNFPKPIRDASGHCWRDPQLRVNANEVVVG